MTKYLPDIHGAIMVPIWGRQDPGGPHVGPMNLAIRAAIHHNSDYTENIHRLIFNNIITLQ